MLCRGDLPYSAVTRPETPGATCDRLARRIGWALRRKDAERAERLQRRLDALLEPANTAREKPKHAKPLR